MDKTTTDQSTYDVLIIGAGLSGIGTACHIRREHPGKRIAILERRQRMGGTWDLFRYPGIRSDSDMFSFGYKFRPWNELKVLADGPSIRRYIAETAQEHQLEECVHYGVEIVEANWSSEEQCWLLTGQDAQSGERRVYRGQFLVSCSGYYDYSKGYRPTFPNEEAFGGEIIHPQLWPEDLDYRNKRVVVIGSGATAVTLVPAMADSAAHVTMLQRSPSYVYSLPGRDWLTGLLARVLPSGWVFALTRKRNILLQQWMYQACRRWPEKARRFLLKRVRKQVGPDFDMRHFTPEYMPWDERLCAVPDDDLFRVLREGKASVVTDKIERFTEHGIRTASGTEIPADIIVTATGLQLQLMGGVTLKVDGQARPLKGQMTYRGALVENVPNMAWIFGYTNASWTLKADLVGEYLCRLLGHMDANHYRVVWPRDNEGQVLDEGILDSLQAGYVQRGRDAMPRQGRTLPWRVFMNYGCDRKQLLEDPVEDEHLTFIPANTGSGESAQPARAA